LIDHRPVSHTDALSKKGISVVGRNASEAQLGLPSEAEEVSGRLTASIAHRYHVQRTNRNGGRRMRLERTGLAIVLAAALVALIGAPAAASTEKGTGSAFETPPLARLIMDNLGRLLVLRSELGVTDEQKQKIQGIVKSHRKEIVPAITGVHEKRKALREAVLNNPVGQEAIRAAAADLGKAMGEAAILRARVGSEVRQVLKPEQQDRIKRFRTDLDRSVETWLTEFGK